MKKPPAADAACSLVYVSDGMPGIRRLRRGEGFAYRTPEGRWLRDEAELARIRRLAIPPAYREVWICPLPNGHLQATGRDARGRKQYRYHPQWSLSRDADKFERMREFGAALPLIRRGVARDLRLGPGEPPGRASLLAALVQLLDTTLIRVGNDEYARENGSFGLTTLRRRHAEVRGGWLRLRFRGKSGVLQEAALEDARVARIVRRCQALPGQELFHYQDESGETHRISSADVNDYLRGLAGSDFSAKDFRTWHATVYALELTASLREGEGASRSKVNELLAAVASRLGNTVAVCRKSYVHPAVLELAASAASEDRACGQPSGLASRALRGLSLPERALMDFLAQASGAVAFQARNSKA